MVRCGECGREAELDEAWAWSTAQPDPGTESTDDPIVLCDTCTRTHARSIEAKLDHEWW